MKICTNCNTELPVEAKFCFNCGLPQTTSLNATQNYNIDFDGDVKQQLVDLFFELFHQRIIEEHNAAQHKDYVELLYKVGFRESVQLRAEQMVKEIDQQALELRATNQLIENSFEGLMDYFIIHYAKDLNKVELSERILKHEGIKLENIDLQRLIFDYLDFEKEQETLYTDFFQMPPKKVRNASQSFLFAAPTERVFFICDQSLLGSCKEGFAMTNDALYWKMPLQKAERVYYDKIEEVKREKNWLTINGMFFNVNTSINLKMMKLLKKLRRLNA